MADKSTARGDRGEPRGTPRGASLALLLACGLLVAAGSPLEAQTTWYRSLGTAADYGTLEPVLGNGTQVSVTNLSNVVDGVGGTTWSAENRGRGDRINIAGVDYTVLSVDSDTRLTLTAPYAAATATVNYAISRKFTTVEAWVACIEFDVACEGVSSSSLVADDRAEVGVAYKDSVFTPAIRVQIPNNALAVATDATHDITLTADPGNRHYGVPGAGVVLDNPTCLTLRNSVRVHLDYFTLEWIEVRNAADDAVKLYPQTASNHLVVRNNLIRYPDCAFADASVGADALDLDSQESTVITAEVYNNVISRGRYNIIIDAFDEGSSDIRIFNNTVYDCGLGVPCGLRSLAGSNTHIRATNNIFHTGVGPQISAPTPNASSGYNITSDTTATQNCPGATCQCPAGSCQVNVALGSLSFVDSANDDFHIQSGSVAHDAAVDLSSEFGADFDDQTRSGSWDIGADEFGATPCCALSVSETSSTLTVTGAGQFEMVFSTTAGGGIEKLYDLVEDPLAQLDLVGSDPASTSAAALHNFGISVTGPTFYNSGNDQDGGARMHLLEATPARVRVRQSAFYHEAPGSTSLGGVKGFGDYSVYGVGKVGLHWERHVTTPAGITYLSEYKELFLHYLGAGPLNGWVPYHDAGSAFNGSGLSDFLMGQNESAGSPGARTDILEILFEDWDSANGHFNTADSVNTAAVVGNERRNIFWREDTGDTNGFMLPNGRVDVWDSLTWIKPTGFANHSDSQVVTRRQDYRYDGGVCCLSAGTRWVDDAENTPLAAPADYFNQAEEAYVFDMDPATGLSFDLYGSAITKRSPFFKIRQWRSVDPYVSASVETVPATPDVDYRAAVKPLSRGHWASSLAWHCSMEGTTACDSGNLDVGLGIAGSTTGTVTAETGKHGNALRFDQNTDSVTANAADFNPSVGGVDFWYQPFYNHNDGGGPYLLWYERSPSGPNFDCFYLAKLPTNALVFRVRIGASDNTCTAGGTQYSIFISQVNYSWRAYDWVHLKTTWNSSPLAGTRKLRLEMNGVELGTSSSFIAPLGAQDFRFGGCSLNCPLGTTANANGLMDEIHVYGGLELNNYDTNSPFAHGGLVSHASESLADPARNWTLGLTAVDASRRGSYLYFGADSKFRGLNVRLATAGVWSTIGDLAWEYWNSATGEWADLEAGCPGACTYGFVDETTHFTENGTVHWAEAGGTTDPVSWGPYSVNGGPELYYVRVHLPAGGSYATLPVESRITTDILLFQYCADVSTDGVDFDFSAPVPTPVTLMAFEALASDAAVQLTWETGSELLEPGLPRRPLAVGGWPVDSSHAILDPRPRLFGPGHHLLLDRRRPHQWDALLLPPRGRGHRFGVGLPRAGVRHTPGLSRKRRGGRRRGGGRSSRASRRTRPLSWRRLARPWRASPARRRRDASGRAGPGVLRRWPLPLRFAGRARAARHLPDRPRDDRGASDPGLLWLFPTPPGSWWTWPASPCPPTEAPWTSRSSAPSSTPSWAAGPASSPSRLGTSSPGPRCDPPPLPPPRSTRAPTAPSAPCAPASL